MNQNLHIIEIAGRVGMSCALATVVAVGIFMLIRFVAWLG